MKHALSHKTTLSIIAPTVWAITVFLGTAGSAFVFSKNFNTSAKGTTLGLFTSETPVLLENNYKMQNADARAAKIDAVFEKFKCPLAGKGEFVVKMADEFEIPYWLVPAVSFQESGCGKKSPKIQEFEESYNAWGYGVWGGNVKTFDDWEAGIKAVSKYFGTNFYSKGITDPCEIMKIYTPPSNGSWCEGVKYFGELIEDFESE